MEIQVTIHLAPDNAETLAAMLASLARYNVAPVVSVASPDDSMGPLETEFMRRNPGRTKRLVMTAGNIAKYGNREAFAASLLSDSGTVSPDSVTETESAPTVPPVPLDELDDDDI